MPKIKVEKGLFLRELYELINIISVKLPDLSDRKQDIPALAQFFLHKFRNGMGKKNVDFSPKTIGRLMEYHWPGNVRELENVVERALMLCDGKRIKTQDLVITPAQPSMMGFDTHLIKGSLNLDEIERAAILEALNRSGNVQKRAAELLGISPRVIHYKINKYNLAK